MSPEQAITMTFRHAAREVRRSETTVVHDLHHPNGTPAQCHWGQDATLHVAAMYSNPCRFRTRTRLFNDFRRHMEALPNVKLYVAELAYGDRPFEVTSGGCDRDLQLRTRTELWHKENVLNRLIETFEPGWEYGAYVDGDFHFTRTDVALETIHQLQHYDWVQMFHSHTNLGPNHQIIGVGIGFVAAILERIAEGEDPATYDWPGSPGGAWAFRHEAFDAVGGLLDTCILGSGDYYMARGLMQIEHKHPELHGCGPKYAESILTWHKRAAILKANIGFVDGMAVHHFHGPLKNRGYNWRWKILRENHFNPFADIFRDAQGVYQLTPDKPRLRDDIRAYFRSRNEDDISL